MATAAAAPRPPRRTAAELIAEARSELARGPAAAGRANELHASISHDVSLGSTCMFLQKGTDRMLEHQPQPRIAPRYARAYTSERFRSSLQAGLGADRSEPEPEPEPEPPMRPRSLEPLETPAMARFDLPPPDESLSRLYKRPLERSDPNTVYPQFNGGWACDACGVTQSAEMFHCPATDAYDLCAGCLEKGLGYSIDGPVDDEALPRLPSRGGVATDAALGTTFRVHNPQPDASLRESGAGSPVGRRTLRNPDAALDLELSRQEFFAIYRQHTTDEVRTVVDATAKAAHKPEDTMPTSSDTIEKKLTRLYRSIDSDFSNSVDAKELWEGLSRIGLSLSRETVNRMKQEADADGDGSLDLQEFLTAFTSSFLGSDMASGSHETQWGPSTLVRLDPLLSRLTVVDSEGKAIMERSEVTEAIWRYIETEFLGERSGKPDSMIELDKNLAAVFGLPEEPSDGGGDKKKKKKKDGEMPEIPQWQFTAMMDAKVDAMLTPIFKPRNIATPADTSESSEPLLGVEEEGPLADIVDMETTWALHGLELAATGCAPMAETGSSGADSGVPKSLQARQIALDESRVAANDDGPTQSKAKPEQHLGITQYLALDEQCNPQQRTVNIGPDVVAASVEAITPRSAFLAATQEQQLLPLPLPLLISTPDAEEGDVRGATVELCGHSLGQRYTSALATALCRFDSDFMSTFGLQGGGLEDAKGAQLIQSISHQEELTGLDLSHNLFSKATVKELEALLVPPEMKIFSLNLSTNRLGDAGVQLLTTSMTSGTSWSSEEGHRHYPNKTVKRLDLSSNGFGFIGASALASWLNHNGTLTELAIGSNTIGTPGCNILAEALEANGATQLRVLDFAHCQILDEGAEALLRAVQENDSLRNQLELLDVSHNSLGTDVMASLVELLGDKVRVDEGQPAPERKKNQASDDSDASSSIFGRATSLIDHRLQEREAKVAAIASAAERKAAAEATAARKAQEAAAAQAASVARSEFLPGPSWRLHYPTPEFQAGGYGLHYPLEDGLSN
jgi:Ran GTPase-activating protein (RanGAP) involved in mRNA processing and transport